MRDGSRRGQCWDEDLERRIESMAKGMQSLPDGQIWVIGAWCCKLEMVGDGLKNDGFVKTNLCVKCRMSKG